MKSIILNEKEINNVLNNNEVLLSKIITHQPKYIEQSGRWIWSIPKSKIHKGCCTEVCSASREWWEYLSPDQFPYNKNETIYVKETFASLWEGYRIRYNNQYGNNPKLVYKADHVNGIDYNSITWESSVHMTQNESRILLLIKNIKASIIDGKWYWDIICSMCE